MLREKHEKKIKKKFYKIVCRYVVTHQKVVFVEKLNQIHVYIQEYNEHKNTTFSVEHWEKHIFFLFLKRKECHWNSCFCSDVEWKTYKTFNVSLIRLKIIIFKSTNAETCLEKLEFQLVPMAFLSFVALLGEAKRFSTSILYTNKAMLKNE